MLIYEEIEGPLGDAQPTHVVLVEQTVSSLSALTGAAVHLSNGGG